MINIILKRIPKREYNKHKHDSNYIMFPYYKIGRNFLYKINNPPDYYRCYKIIYCKANFVISPKVYDKLKKECLI